MLGLCSVNWAKLKLVVLSPRPECDFSECHFWNWAGNFSNVLDFGLLGKA
jgi:hypothetical protein